MDVFRQDIIRAKVILEDITGKPVRGFRAAGFGITEKAPWAFDVIKESGYQYDSSVFPASRRHGGISDSLLRPYFIETGSGHLLEVPMSVVKAFGCRVSLFGGGYLRLANKQMIKWGISRLRGEEQPLVVYIHPREIDPDQPRLPLSFIRGFKCYINLKSTLPKLKWLCENYSFCPMLEMIEDYVRLFYLDSRTIPVVHLQGSQAASEPSPTLEGQTVPANREALRSRLLLVEKAMANFLSPSVPRSHETTQD